MAQSGLSEYPLANLNDESYSKIGKVLHKVLEDYVKEWNESKTN